MNNSTHTHKLKKKRIILVTGVNAKYIYHDVPFNLVSNIFRCNQVDLQCGSAMAFKVADYILEQNIVHPDLF